MRIVETIEEVRQQVKEWKKAGQSVGFVPTMGYLHEGHQSLITKANEQNDRVVVSIFVNPTQFAPNEDLESYPRDIDRDAELCEKAGADLIFHPTPEIMYDRNAVTKVMVESMANELCGQTRPTHFAGVCLVVSKLFHIVAPDHAYFGQKDAQQLAIIKRMVKDLNFDIEIIGCPIIREADGLAKSSRNIYLSKEERKAATVLSRALSEAQLAIKQGEKDAKAVKEMIETRIQEEPLARIDYVDVVNYDTLKSTDKVEGTILVALAVYFSKARLIDNFIMESENLV